MTAPVDHIPQGVPYEIGAVLVQALRAAPELAGAQVLDNPSYASDLADGTRLIFFEDQGDKPVAGKANYRSYGFAVGVISRSADGARLAAHSDYRIAKRVLRTQGMQWVQQRKVWVAGTGITEGDVRYRLENIDVGGALVLGSFAFEYRDQM